MKNITRLKFRYLVLIAVAIFSASAIITLSFRQLSRRQSKVEESSPDSSPLIIAFSPTPYPYTGVDTAQHEEFRKQHPELAIEASLQSNLPLELDGFILDYSYENDKFTVRFIPPIEKSRLKFDNWMKETGLTDLNRFLFL